MGGPNYPAPQPMENDPGEQKPAEQAQPEQVTGS